MIWTGSEQYKNICFMSCVLNLNVLPFVFTMFSCFYDGFGFEVIFKLLFNAFQNVSFVNFPHIYNIGKMVWWVKRIRIFCIIWNRWEDKCFENISNISNVQGAFWWCLPIYKTTQPIFMKFILHFKPYTIKLLFTPHILPHI